MPSTPVSDQGFVVCDTTPSTSWSDACWANVRAQEYCKVNQLWDHPTCVHERYILYQKVRFYSFAHILLFFLKLKISGKFFQRWRDQRAGKHSWERGKVIYSEAELSQISDYSNKRLTFLSHFLKRDSGLKNKVCKLRSLIISLFKLTWWLLGVLKVYARNSLASQGSVVEADKVTWGIGAACFTPLALPLVSSWHEDESSSLSIA